MPDFPIIDTHVHFWDRAEAALEWFPEDTPIDRPYYPEDLTDDAGEIEIESLVFVEADVLPGEAQREAEWVSRLADRDERIKGIVAYAPVHLGADAAADLDALSSLPLVKSIRRLIQNEPDPAFCITDAFIEGVKLLPDYGYSFEICIFHTQLPAAIQLVEACPEVSFNLNHIGKPGIRDGLREPWWREIADLASLPNINCKMSGVATEADHEHWEPEQLLAYMGRALEVFGPSRVMFGGDWPVSTLAITYPRWVELVDELLADLTEDEQRAIYCENARDFYRL